MLFFCDAQKEQANPPETAIVTAFDKRKKANLPVMIHLF